MINNKPRQGSAKSTRRRTWRIALSHNQLADVKLDGLAKMQTSLNILIDKLENATPASLPTDFSASQVGEIINWDRKGSGHGHRQTLRWALLHVYYSQELCDEILDSIEELQVVLNILCAKLDAEGGMLTSTDWAETLHVQLTDPTKKIPGRAHASYRAWLVNGLAANNMCDEFIGWLQSAQKTLNAVIKQLDAGTTTGMPEKVKVLDPEERMR